MELRISHVTRYSYDAPVGYALQRLRLEPQSDRHQQIKSWQVELEGAQRETEFVDHHGNKVILVSTVDEPMEMVITAHGFVETRNNDGVIGPHTGPSPLWLYQRETPLTAAGKGIRLLTGTIGAPDRVADFHALMEEIARRVDYVIGATFADTEAEVAFSQGSGVCQDHAHIMIAAARFAGVPARYVSGYLMMNDRIDQVASHAWAEVHIEGLGWVGFDPSNGISPDERYVRVATGCDFGDARPVAGIRKGAAKEALDVRIAVEQ